MPTDDGSLLSILLLCAHQSFKLCQDTPPLISHTAKASSLLGLLQYFKLCGTAAALEGL